MQKTSKNFLNKISVGDMLYYCPKDLKEENHDIGIIYEIQQASCVKYKIFWQRTQLFESHI